MFQQVAIVIAAGILSMFLALIVDVLSNRWGVWVVAPLIAVGVMGLAFIAVKFGVFLTIVIAAIVLTVANLYSKTLGRFIELS